MCWNYNVMARELITMNSRKFMNTLMCSSWEMPLLFAGYCYWRLCPLSCGLPLVWVTAVLVLLWFSWAVEAVESIYDEAFLSGLPLSDRAPPAEV